MSSPMGDTSLFLFKNKVQFIAIIILLLLTVGLSLFIAPSARASDQLISFEEPIAVPSNVKSQYCNSPDTNKGVEFPASVSIVEPPVATASGTHAAVQIAGNDDVGTYAGGIQIAFTTGQNHVGVRVGLDEEYDVDITAFLRAYDDADVGEGDKLTPDPDPSVSLGMDPTAVTQALSFALPDGEATIRRVEIIFVDSNGASVREVIDDLTYSDIGPTCVTDNQAPTVEIFKPVANATLTSPETLLHYKAEDIGSGIARIEVSAFDASDDQLSSGFVCGGPAFPSTCPGNLSVEQEYFTHFPRGTRKIQVEATDFAGNTGQDEVVVDLVLPEADYNLWAMGVELTQNIQQHVPTTTESRSDLAPQVTLDTVTIPMVANKRTVLRLYPGIEGASVPVPGVRARLSCYVFLAANLSGSTPCDGPAETEAVEPEIAVDPANGNDLDTLRRDQASSWNFILPEAWTRPGGPRYLVAHIQAPIGLAECGTFSSGCDDGANFFILRVPAFLETAPLIVKPHFACVRRDSNVPKETCDAVATTPEDAVEVAQWFLEGNDWDSDGVLDPYFSLLLPIADGGAGVEIRTPVINDYADGDLSTANGIMNYDKMGDYLAQLCDEFNFDFLELFTDPGEIIATAYPRNLRYLAFVPPPTGPSGLARYNDPCGIAKVDLDPGRIGDGTNAPENDYCSGCADDPRSTIHWDEPNVIHETTHTLDVRHASCDHDEGQGDNDCDPAPADFPCPHGGICLSAANPDALFGFNPYALSVMPPYSGMQHTHDYMSYGPRPNWVSAHTYKQVFDKLRSWLASASPLPEAGAGPVAAQAALYVSGQIDPGGSPAGTSINTVYELPQLVDVVQGSGDYSLEMQNDQGQTLTVRRFEPASSSDGDAGAALPFFQIVGLDPDATLLLLKKGEQVIAERPRSKNTPSVEVLAPAGGAQWALGPETIVWQASDADGDPLLFTVQYRADEDSDWITLGVNLEADSLEVHPRLLAGSNGANARIRVFATDGFNSAHDSSPAFEVDGKPPIVNIRTPQPGGTFLEGELIDLMGTAFDPEDGSLQDPAFTWSSNLDGSLGQGHNLLVRNLSPGGHILRLHAEDSNGMSAEAIRRIVVLERTNRQPLAVAGSNVVVRPGAQVMLDGAASYDPDGDVLEYSWRFVANPGGALPFGTLQNADTPDPNFIAGLPGEYVLELVVRDGRLNSNPSQVVVRVAENVLYLGAIFK